MSPRRTPTARILQHTLPSRVTQQGSRTHATCTSPIQCLLCDWHNTRVTWVCVCVQWVHRVCVWVGVHCHAAPLASAHRGLILPSVQYTHTTPPCDGELGASRVPSSPRHRPPTAASRASEPQLDPPQMELHPPAAAPIRRHLSQPCPPAVRRPMAVTLVRISSTRISATASSTARTSPLQPAMSRP